MELHFHVFVQRLVHVCKSCVCVDMLLSLQGTFKKNKTKKTPDASVALHKYTFMDAKKMREAIIQLLTAETFSA